MLGTLAIADVRLHGQPRADSAGLAVFMEPVARSVAAIQPVFVRIATTTGARLNDALTTQIGQQGEVEGVENHATLISPVDPTAFRAWLAQYDSSLHLLSVGRSIDVYKDTGHACDMAKRYGFEKLNASHCVGHTRMATESAVTPYHSHPFTAGEDFCLVHNGSLSNPYSLRRRLEKYGVEFETDNDTEAACRFLEWRMRSGDDLETACTLRSRNSTASTRC